MNNLNMKNEAEELAEQVARFVNGYRSKGEEFCKEMTFQHRTLQQSFTRLCLQWLETCAGEDYLTDGRNQPSKEIAKELIETFQEKKCNILPSKWLPMV